MKITGEGGEGGLVSYERMASHSLSKVLVSDAHFLVLVVELTPFLSISVCWCWIWD